MRRNRKIENDSKSLNWSTYPRLIPHVFPPSEISQGGPLWWGLPWKKPMGETTPASQGGLPWVARVLKVGLEFYVMPVVRRLGSPRSQRFVSICLGIIVPWEKKKVANTKRMCFPRSIRWLPPMVRWKLNDKQRTKSLIDGFFLVKVNFQILGENLTLLQFYPFLAYTFLFPSGFTFRTKRSFLKVLDHGCACTNLYGCWSNMACKLSGENDKNPCSESMLPRQGRAEQILPW